LFDTNKFLASSSDVPSKSIQAFHIKLLAKISSNIEIQSITKREVSANIMAIDVKDLPKAKDMLRDFRRKFAKKMGESKDKNEVYSLNMQFTKLTND